MTQPPDLTAPESTAPESTGSDTRDTSLTVRAPAVAGFFYPDSPTDIDSTASALIDRARQHTAPSDSEAHPARAIIVPHAGWRYSGDLAALGWAYAARSRPPNHTNRPARPDPPCRHSGNRAARCGPVRNTGCNAQYPHP